MKSFRWIFALLLAASTTASIIACDPPERSPGAGLLEVGVSVAPQKFIVERIARGGARVQVLIPSGADPHSYEPGPDQLRVLSDLGVYFRQGLEFETACLRRLQGVNPAMQIVDLGPGVVGPPGARDVSPEHEHRNIPGLSPTASHSHSHAAGHEHLNPHTWLSPRLVRAQSDLILNALAGLRPDERSRFERGHRELQADIARVDRYIRRRLAPVRGRLLVVYHPSWEYFAHEYGLKMLAIQDEGHQPSARDLMRLVRAAREAGVKAVFAEPGFDPRSVEVVARDIGARVETIDPLAEDWEQNLCDTADLIAEALAP